MRQPTLYIPHGAGPCFFMDWTWGPPTTWDAVQAYLQGLIASLPSKPTAIVVVSAHWECEKLTVQGAPQPELIFDYHNFPAQTYQLTWPAPGSPHLARRLATLLGADLDTERGFDHGAFIPLKVAVPDADIPTIQLSLRADLDPEAHLEIGRSLAPLREEGVLILGSGLSYHDLRRLGKKSALEDSIRFDAWLEKTVSAPNLERSDALLDWSTAPAARLCHPREEHLLPLMVCAGAAGEDEGRVDLRAQVMGVQISAIRFG